jgi:hypothetical protein
MSIRSVGIEMGEEMGKESRYDTEEVKELLAAVSDFLKGLKEPIMDFMKIITESFSGEKIGKEVAAFYKSLIEAGIDAETAKKWTEKFMDERLNAFPTVSSLGEVFGKIMEKRPKVKISEEKEDEPEP